MKSKSKKRMTESQAKELEKQELRHNADQSTGNPIDIPPVESTAAPVEIINDPGEDEIDRVVKEQQALLDARLQKEADEAAEKEIREHEQEQAETSKAFQYTCYVNFRHYVKVQADSKEEAMEKISELKMGDYIDRKDVRFDKEVKL